MDPVFNAVSSSVKQLWQLLRCVGFNNKAQILITRQGLRVTVEESQIMQGFCGIVNCYALLTSDQALCF